MWLVLMGGVMRGVVGVIITDCQCGCGFEDMIVLYLRRRERERVNIGLQLVSELESYTVELYNTLTVEF